MPTVNPDHPAEPDISLDKVLAALADPIRRDVLKTIAERGPLFCGEYQCDVSKSTLSHHLTYLREAGLLHTEVIGVRRQITRRDPVVEHKFPGLLTAVGLPPAQGQWPD